MDIRIINSPTSGTWQIIKSRLALSGVITTDMPSSIGMVQGKMIDMICAADIAEKQSGVEAHELRGLCPQHMTMIVLLGDTAAVKTALKEIKTRINEGAYRDNS